MRTYMNISLFSYLDRPIFDVDMNGTDFMSALEHSFYGSNAVMVEQMITLGPQIVTWRLDGPEGMPRNGETVRARNIPILNEIPSGVTWLALHIYDDETVEIKLSKGSKFELETERGRKIIDAWRAKHGK
ncbi:hypothetical protein [Massilia alkalitolerans]|uniref:hypothetical protein n=1 Tax=Massilia alkalitolerans TaxID=286638 RepID=UPI000488DACD|nr:hypothetical protein [Massilia alkalitolerans]